MFKPLSAQIEGTDVVCQGYAVLKLARLSYSGDRDAQNFLPSWEFPEGFLPFVRLPDVLSTPVWFQNKEDKQFGEFDYENGPFVDFNWRDLWAMYIAQGDVRESIADPHRTCATHTLKILRCAIICDLQILTPHWRGYFVDGLGINFKFIGVFGWQLPRRTLIQPCHFQCSNVI